MKLTKVRVSDFQSVRDSTEFAIGDATCLVGKNEAGKTALLQAIYRLRPIIDTDSGYRITDDYPRRDVADYEYAIEEGDREHAIVAHLTYELDDADVAAVADTFGPKALSARTLTISKAYEQDDINFSLDVDEVAALQHLLSIFSVPDETHQVLKACSTPEEAKEAVTGLEKTEAIQEITKWLDAITFSHNWWSHTPTVAKAYRAATDKVGGPSVAETGLSASRVATDAEVAEGCMAIDAGRDLRTFVDDDHWGTERPSTPTMGAHEPTSE